MDDKQAESSGAEMASASSSEAAINNAPVTKRFRAFTPIIVLLFIAVVGILGFVLVKKNEIPPVTQPVSIEKESLLPLSLESPKEGDLAVNDEILVKGKTDPNTTVIVFTDNDETSMESDAAGNFESTITLSGGVNTLRVSAFSDNGKEKTLSITIARDEKS